MIRMIGMIRIRLILYASSYVLDALAYNRTMTGKFPSLYQCSARYALNSGADHSPQQQYSGLDESECGLCDPCFTIYYTHILAHQ